MKIDFNLYLIFAYLKVFVRFPRAPTSKGITSIFLKFESLWISHLRFWYVYIFFFSLSVILLSPGIAASVIFVVFSFLLTIAISGFLSTVILSHCIFMSHISLWFTFSDTVWGWCRYHFQVLLKPRTTDPPTTNPPTHQPTDHLSTNLRKNRRPDSKHVSNSLILKNFNTYFFSWKFYIYLFPIFTEEISNLIGF